jgi:EmrB/QacA subfamily drug resistance transporter
MTANTNNRHKWLIFFTCALLLLLMNFDMTAVNLALAPIATELHLNIVNVQWIISAYLIGGASMVMLGGLLGDIYGHKTIFLFGAVTFTLASIGVGIAHHHWTLILMRLLQGFGAALAWPLAIVIVRHAFAGKEGLAMGLIAAVMATTMSIGPPLGGIILHFLNWRWIFLINIPLGLLVIIMATRYLPKDFPIKKQQKLHLPSAFLLVIGLLSLTFSLNEGQYFGFESFYFLIPFITGIILLGSFLMIQRVIKQPLLDLQLFKNIALSNCFIVRFFWQVIWIGLFLIMSLYLQNILGFSAIHTSVYFLSLTLSYAIVSPFGGRLNDAFSTRQLLTAGISLSLIPLALLTSISNTSSMWQIITIFSLYGCATAIVFPALLNGTLALAPVERRGMVSGILYMMLFLGGSIGAIGVGIFINHFAPRYFLQQAQTLGLTLNEVLHTNLISLTTGVRNIFEFKDKLTDIDAKSLVALIQQSFTYALNNAMKAALLISILMLCSAAFIKSKENSK